MKRLFILISFALVSLALPAQADFRLLDMVGNWGGSGVYSEGVSKARMRCRISVTGDDAKVTLTGRCGSSLGAADVVLDFIAIGDGKVTVQPGDGAPASDSPITMLTGQLSATQLNVSGANYAESVVMQFVKNTDGTLNFATKRKWRTGRSQSTIRLVRR